MRTPTTRPARRIQAARPAPPAPGVDAEQLAQRWLERMDLAGADDLAQLVEVLGNLPSRERTVVQNVALARAKTEQQRRPRQGRLVAAGAAPARPAAPAVVAPPAPPVATQRPAPAPAAEPRKIGRPRKLGRPRKEKQPASVATPVFNARKSTKGKPEGSPIGRMLEEMRKLSPTHPRRLAYAAAARTGTGHDAFLAWQNWPKQQKGGPAA